MNLSFYNAALGASEQQKRMQVQGNNIANVNTVGYKAEVATFASLMYANVESTTGPIVSKGSGARLIMDQTNFTQGAFRQTFLPLDFAIAGEGFFALEDPETGEISYSRDGTFAASGFQQPDETGTLQTVFLLSDGDGRFVLDAEGNTIPVVEREAQGTPGVYGFQNEDGLAPVGDNRFLPVEKNGAPTVLTDVPVFGGYVETSNADLGVELTKVIEAQRSYSYALRMVQTSDEVETTINGLKT